MFGSYLIELVVGLCFLFAVLGIVTSAVTEAALTILKVRSAHLSEWLLQWVAQLQRGGPAAGRGATPVTLQALLQHPLLASQSRGTDQASYLQPGQLATALLQTIGMPFGAACLGQDLKTAEAGLRAHIAALPSDGLKQAMGALLNNAVGKAKDGTALVASLHAETEAWIDSSMNRVEGWTRRHAKKFSLGSALAICVFFNVNALEVLRVLSTDPQLRAQLASTAIGYAAKTCGAALAAAPAASAAAASATAAAATSALSTPATAGAAWAPASAPDTAVSAAQATATVDCLRSRTEDAMGALGPQSRLGIGWDNPPRFLSATGLASAGLFLWWVFGVAVATFAVSLGGDFWFKWIGDIVRLTGYRPPTKEEPAAPKPTVP